MELLAVWWYNKSKTKNHLTRFLGPTWLIIGCNNEGKMVERRLTWRDQAGLPQPARAGLLALASRARETHAARDTTADGVSFFVFLSRIARSQHKQRSSHQTSQRSLSTSAGDWRWRVYLNNVAATTTNRADPLDTLPWGHFLAWTSCSEPQHTPWLITLPQIGGHKEERTHTSASYPSSCGACHCMWCFLCPLPPCTLFTLPSAACAGSIQYAQRSWLNSYILAIPNIDS